MSSLKIQPSPPPSPTEEDISRAGAYADEEAGASSTTGRTRRQKQKQRAEGGPFVDDEESDSSDGAPGRTGSYPPTNDEEAESRKVEENLRKWEAAEKERRRAVRDSSSTVASTSLVGDVTRKASWLWPGKRSRQAAQGAGIHHIIPSSEDGVPMDDIVNDTAMPLTPEHENPFTTPMASVVSLNTPDDSAIMTESTSAKELSDSATTPTATAAPGDPLPRSHPPPQPLDLPKPRTPPPRNSIPHTDRPPEPIAAPNVNAGVGEEDASDKRWWTDWLCGCRQDGDNQAARTNPFE